MSLWLCLRFQQLPLQCLNRSEQQPVVVLERQRVLRANDCASALGIRQGMGAATARALVGNGPLQLLQRDETTEQHCLQQLCCWAYSITPTLYSWRQDCLQLEIGGCLSLFRGLDSLLQEVASGIASRGFHMEYGLAPTPRAAWLLSFAGPEQAAALHCPLEERLAPLPLTLLDDFATRVDSLRRAGLHTLGDILALPPRALARRCGRAFCDMLDKVLGRQQDLQPDYQPPTTFSDHYWFGYEVRANGELLPAVQLLLQSLCRFLRNTQLQTAEIHWQLAGLDGNLREVCVRSGCRHSDWQNWYQLTCIRFERLELHTAVEGLSLAARELAQGQLENIDLFSSRHQREPLANLLDRLRSRLGLQAVSRISCRDEHLPEFAMQVGEEHCCQGGEQKPPCAQRPFWLMPQPQALQIRRGHLYWRNALHLVYGPERIEDNWWRQAVSRDYYIARDSDGHHYWVFRDRLAGQWYVHGIFA
jgi:protein ImuB